MTHQEIFITIKSILRAFLHEETDKLTESTHLVDDLGINSARLVDIVLELEDNFGISIDDSEMFKLSTIGGVIELVSSLLPAAQQPLDEVGAN